MKNWNKTGKIKAIILAILFFPNLIVASPVHLNLGLLQFIIPLLFGAFALPLIIKLNAIFGVIKIEKPSWNENPINLNHPLVFFQFATWLILTNGISMIIGAALIHHTFHAFGLLAIMFGIGTLIGIRLTIKWFGKS